MPAQTQPSAVGGQSLVDGSVVFGTVSLGGVFGVGVLLLLFARRRGLMGPTSAKHSRLSTDEQADELLFGGDQMPEAQDEERETPLFLE